MGLEDTEYFPNDRGASKQIVEQVLSPQYLFIPGIERFLAMDMADKVMFEQYVGKRCYEGSHIASPVWNRFDCAGTHAGK